MQHNYLVQEFFHFFLVFVRTTGAVMLIPGFGQVEVPGRVRTILALALAFSLTPCVVTSLPSSDIHYVSLFTLTIREFIIGCFIGIIGRTLFSILDMAGNLISYQLNLSNATLFNPGMVTQGVITSLMLTTAGSTILFVFDLHHLMIKAVVHSYTLIPAQKALLIGDFSHSFIDVLATTFSIAVQFAAPFLIVGTVLQIALGLLNRLVPQLHVFFVGMPVQIGFGFFVLMLVISSMLLRFGQLYDDHFHTIFQVS
jgi:flagellar biosynthetic protein FliR